MSHMEDSTPQRLHALRTNYLSQLPLKIDAINLTWSILDIQQWNPDTGWALQHMLHRLADSSATFGLSAVAGAASQCAHLLKEILDSGGVPSTEQWQHLGTALDILRQAVVASPDTDSTTWAAPAVRGRGMVGENQTILLVDDDTDFSRDLAVQLEFFGYTVHCIDQLGRLTEAIHSFSPDALVLDLMFPEGDLAGAQVIHNMRVQQALTIPVIFLSSRHDIPARLAAVRAGGAAYCPKPIDAATLVDALDQLTGQNPPNPYRVLIVEDSLTQASYYDRILRQAGMSTLLLTDPLQIAEPLNEFRPDLLLVDLYMPTCTGLELAAVIRQQEHFAGLPLLFLSSETSYELHLAALYEGGDDFLTKTITPDYLVRIVNNRARRARAQQAQMVRDSLTGLLNHTAFESHLETEIGRARRKGSPLSLAILDLDHFKTINDSYGHPTGDRVIKSVARLLRQRLRKADSIGRYGGEEFGIVLPDTDGPTACRVMDTIRDSVAHLHQHAHGATFSITVSGGVASFPSAPNAVALTAQADAALYQSKHAGRNRITLID